MLTNDLTLIDAAWWVGGNRRRGIGKYLAYFFEYVFPVKAAARVWLFPATVPAREIADFTARFGGKAEIINTADSAEQQAQWLTELIERYSVKRVLFSSPFERPWSLLDHVPLFIAHKIPTQAIVFDLLPLQFTKEILATWPLAEQKIYRTRASHLRLLDAYWAISPQTAHSLERLLAVAADRIQILKFGLTTAWLKPPPRGTPPTWPHPEKKAALTISGGEWRKNLAGTLAYFARKLMNSHDLAIICRLSLREHFRLRRQTLQSDSYNAVRFLGEVNERDKWRYLYSTDIFLFLSLAEGLGIPLLEARAAGVPRVIISQELYDQGFHKLVPGCEVVKTTPTRGSIG